MAACVVGVGCGRGSLLVAEERHVEFCRWLERAELIVAGGFKGRFFLVDESRAEKKEGKS